MGDWEGTEVEANQTLVFRRLQFEFLDRSHLLSSSTYLCTQRLWVLGLLQFQIVACAPRGLTQDGGPQSLERYLQVPWSQLGLSLSLQTGEIAWLAPLPSFGVWELENSLRSPLFLAVVFQITPFA